MIVNGVIGGAVGLIGLYLYRKHRAEQRKRKAKSRKGKSSMKKDFEAELQDTIREQMLRARILQSPANIVAARRGGDSCVMTDGAVEGLTVALEDIVKVLRGQGLTEEMVQAAVRDGLRAARA